MTGVGLRQRDLANHDYLAELSWAGGLGGKIGGFIKSLIYTRGGGAYLFKKRPNRISTHFIFPSKS